MTEIDHYEPSQKDEELTVRSPVTQLNISPQSRRSSQKSQSLKVPGTGKLPPNQTDPTDPEELPNQMNLRDELLNCEQKELWQFLSDDFDNSNNYFSETVGYGSALIDPDTDSLVFDDGRRDDSVFSDRKVSSASLRSNLSNISNSIFQTLEAKRGGSIAGSIDKMYHDKKPLVETSEFDHLIESFDKEMTDLKKQSSLSLERKPSIKVSHDKTSSLPATLEATDIVRRRPKPVHAVPTDGGSVKIKRRSLEKQKKISDDDFHVTAEIKKICDQLQAPFSNDMGGLKPKSDFHASFERIKRTSLIERVEEVEERQPLKVESEKLPRKYLGKELSLEPLPLKICHSQENIKMSTSHMPKTGSAFPVQHRQVDTVKSVTLDIDSSEKSDSDSRKTTKGKSPKSGEIDLD